MPNQKDQKALVYWIKEDKAGLEPLSNVSANARFIGSVGPVRWSTDKKWYPARVLMISDDIEALEAKENEVALEILAKKKADESASTKRKRGGRKPPTSEATEDAIAKALGKRPPVPQPLVNVDAKSKKAKKTAKDLLKGGHDDLDASILNVKKNLLSKLSTAPTPVFAPSQDDEDDSEGSDDDSANGNDESEDFEEKGEAGSEADELPETDPSTTVWCDNCQPCKMLSKFGCASGNLTGFFKTLSDFFGNNSEVTEIQYLDLLPISDTVKTVELTAGSNIMISKTVKEELKVFYKNKPSPLVRETLFALYGEQRMRSYNITARGNKPGTYGLQDKVLEAVRDFVNRQVSAERKMKLSGICKLINKRAPEWRRPKSKPKRKASSKDQSEVKVDELPVRKTIKSPRKTRGGAMSPFVVSPSKKTTPRKTRGGATSPFVVSPTKHNITPGKTTPSKATPSKATPNKFTPSKNFNFMSAAGPSSNTGPCPSYGAPPSFGPQPQPYFGPSPSASQPSQASYGYNGYNYPSNYYQSPSKQSAQPQWQSSGWMGFNNYNDQQFPVA